VLCAVIRVSAGSAALLGLNQAALEVAPTTVYIMVGEACRRGCAFCPQSRAAEGGRSLLSRVTWPRAGLEDVARRTAGAHERGEVGRVCVQATFEPGLLQRAEETAAVLRRHTSVPLSLSAALRNVDDMERAFSWGYDHLGLALDAVTPKIYRDVKGGSFRAVMQALDRAARRFPGRITTHLIVGLGETEDDMCRALQWLTDRGVTTALFAFTPVRGTPLADRPPPSLDSYRRLQAARHLIAAGRARLEGLQFDGHGRLVGWGVPPTELAALLATGEAFRTSGCPDCNRPFYNESPGRVPYNYARRLDEDERSKALLPIDESASGRAAG